MQEPARVCFYAGGVGMDNLIALTLMVLIVGFLIGTIIFLNSILGPKSISPAKELPFEMGKVPFRIVRSQIHVKFYLVALLFVVFDVELTYLYPWAITFRHLGWMGFVSMSIFLGVLLLTLVYAWKKGVLSWR
jgi:NADH-quinone oxidoreductase subunit A